MYAEARVSETTQNVAHQPKSERTERHATKKELSWLSWLGGDVMW